MKEEEEEEEEDVLVIHATSGATRAAPENAAAAGSSSQTNYEQRPTSAACGLPSGQEAPTASTCRNTTAAAAVPFPATCSPMSVASNASTACMNGVMLPSAVAPGGPAAGAAMSAFTAAAMAGLQQHFANMSKSQQLATPAGGGSALPMPAMLPPGFPMDPTTAAAFCTSQGPQGGVIVMPLLLFPGFGAFPGFAAPDSVPLAPSNSSCCKCGHSDHAHGDQCQNS